MESAESSRGRKEEGEHFVRQQQAADVPKCGTLWGEGVRVRDAEVFKSLPVQRALVLPPTRCASRQRDNKNAGSHRNEEEEKGQFLVAGSCKRQEAGEEEKEHLVLSAGRLKRQEARDDDNNTRKQRKRAAHLVNGEKEGKRVLQNSILTTLPLDLFVHKVLPCLPLPKIFELRRVSHTWNSLLGSQTVLQQSIAAQQQNQPWLVLARKAPGNCHFAKDLIVYAPSVRRYFPFPFHIFPHISSLLGSNLDCLLYYIKDPMEHTPAGFHMTSAGGLICCYINNVPPKDDYLCEFDSFTLLVFNPLTGHMKILPPLDGINFVKVGRVCLSMLHSQVDNSYKIFVSDHLKWRHYVYVYDSNTGCWETHRLYEISSQCGNIQNADLYRLVGTRENKFTALYGYHMESNTWSFLSVPRPCGLEMPFFVQNVNGRVLLASNSRPNGAPAALQGFTLWELECTPSVGGRWVQLAKTPSKFWNRFHDGCDLPFSDDTSYITNGRLICMTAVDFLDMQYGGNYASPLIYDLALKSWYQLPPYKDGTGFMGLFSFEPTLNIPM